MIQTESNYLLTCLKSFREISEKRYGIAFDLRAIERSVSHLRDQRKALTCSDLRYFESPEHWWFEKFWVFPPEHHISPALQRTTFNFWQLPRNERKVIEALLDVFKSVELVSIILRFIRPEHYGIISPPVERVLDVRRGNDAVETYLNYTVDLRAIREHYLFERTADADMALWVLHEKCFGNLQDQAIKHAYDTDAFMIRLRAKNLVASLAGLSDAQLAQGLEEVRPDLAVLIGCYRLELQIREVAEIFGVTPVGSGLDIDKLIDCLPNLGGVNAVRRENWRRLMRVRNGLFHAGRQPTDKQRNDLIREVVQLGVDLPCFRLERSKDPGR